MINVQTALQLVLSNNKKLVDTIELELPKALNYILADSIASKIDMPNFRQSAMDGYALNMKPNGSKDYKLIGEVKAGDAHQPNLKSGEAVRIFTGAAVPDSANTVIMQEKVIRENDRILIKDDVKENDNIRPQGEQIQKGALALEKGTRIKPAHIGFLSSLGVTKVKVVNKPSIGIVVTGNELIPPTQPLSFGKVYESNAAMLTAALLNLDYLKTTTYRVEDDFLKTKEVLKEALESKDVVLVSGGISVGDYDFVKSAFEELAVEEIFYKVNQKPGKPLFYGGYKNTAVFGLPGNPAAALTCFYLYVYPLLNSIQNASQLELERIKLPLLADHEPKGDRAQFLKAYINPKGVEILTAQSSAMVNSFTVANALACLEENAPKKHKGEQIEVILLPN
jgi:molybdopterin molybdotransferase